MKFFELIKWGSEGRKEEAGEVILRGTLEEIADFVSENGLAWNEIPNSPLGGCFIKMTGARHRGNLRRCSRFIGCDRGRSRVPACPRW